MCVFFLHIIHFLVLKHFLHGTLHGVRGYMVRKQSLGNSGLVGIVQTSLNEPRHGGTTYTEAGFFNHKELL